MLDLAAKAAAAMRVVGMGTGTAKVLVRYGLSSTVRDFFVLDRQDGTGLTTLLKSIILFLGRVAELLLLTMLALRSDKDETGE